MTCMMFTQQLCKAIFLQMSEYTHATCAASSANKLWSHSMILLSVSTCRFPSPSLCRRVAHMVRSGAGITSAGQAVSATMPGGPEAIQPHDAHAPLQQSLGTASFVYIAGRRHNATRHADSESALVVDVSHTAAGRAVQVGDSVCLLCAEHRLGDLAQVRLRL